MSTQREQKSAPEGPKITDKKISTSTLFIYPLSSIFLPLGRINPCSLNFYTERQQDLSRRITTELISARHHQSSCQASVSQIKGLMIPGQPKSQCQFLLPWYLKEKKKIKQLTCNLSYLSLHVRKLRMTRGGDCNGFMEFQ